MTYHDRHYYTGQDVPSVRLTVEQEIDLFARFRADPDNAVLLEQIVRSYMAFALQQARKNMGARTVDARMKCGLGEDDAISAANLGLMEAIRRFKPGQARFTTYAGWWILKYLGEARYEAHAIKVSGSDRKLYSRFAKMKRSGVPNSEIAELTGVPILEVTRILALPEGRQDSFDMLAAALDYQANDDTPEETTMKPCVRVRSEAEEALVDDSPNPLEREELHEKLEAAKMKLGRDELRLLHDRFSRSMSVSQIASSYGVQASEIKKRLSLLLSTLRVHLSN